MKTGLFDPKCVMKRGVVSLTSSHKIKKKKNQSTRQDFGIHLIQDLLLGLNKLKSREE